MSVQKKIIIATGLALFAMFFGAGNMIFPLKVGSESSEHLFPALFAFILSGVGIPFLGVFAVSLYEGDYWKFFNRIGKIPAFFVVTFLILFIGPLFATPRTEVITYSTLFPLLPSYLKNQYLFDFIYFATIFVLIFRQSSIVDIIGWLFSPIKIIAFSILILLGIYFADSLTTVSLTSSQVFAKALTKGYGTMDLLAAFFFCSVTYKNVVSKCEQINLSSEKALAKIMLSGCLLGAFLISLVYAGLIFVGATHAVPLHNVPTEELIEKVSYLVLGKYGAVFVGICVSVACLATAATLAEVTTEYLYSTVFRKKIPRVLALFMVLVVMFMMSILGFEGIMKIAQPILEIIYPALIVLCLVNIYLKIVPQKYHFNFFIRRSVKVREIS